MSYATVTMQLAQLRSRLTGHLLTSDHPVYDEARKTIDILQNARPLAIVRPANAADVAMAVDFARDNGIELAVRSGGHSVARHSVVEDAVVVDLSSMKRISIDPDTRIAHVEAGVTSGDLMWKANEHGLALTTGDTSTVGFGGLVTGGGIGFMVRKYGLSIDSLLSAQVVTAAGDILTVSENRHADLFWAIRGGGGNFGIVTEFTFRLAPVGQILGGDLILPASREVIRGYLEYSANAPDELSTIGNLIVLPPLPFVAPEDVGKVVLAVIVCWTGSIEEGQKAVAPLRALATPVADTLRPMPYPEIYLSTEFQAAPHSASIRSMFAHEISDESIDAALEAMTRITSPFTAVHFRGMGGEFARVSNDATAFAHRDKRYFFALICAWFDPEEDQSPHHGWVESLWEQVRTDADGVYVNFLGSEGEERIRDAYPAKTLARLASIKYKYDPDNVFHHNQNIAPAQNSRVEVLQGVPSYTS